MHVTTLLRPKPSDQTGPLAPRRHHLVPEAFAVKGNEQARLRQDLHLGGLIALVLKAAQRATILGCPRPRWSVEIADE